MSDAETAVKICAQLYKARDTMRGLYGNEFQEKVAKYQGYIRKAQWKYECDSLEAMMALVKKLQENENDTGMAQAMLMAAFVEISEEHP